MNITRVIDETITSFMNEKLANVDDDVNYIYDTYFAADVNEIDETGKLGTGSFQEHGYDNSSVLKSEDSIAAHNVNPVTIEINPSNGNNSYNPSNGWIQIGINKKAIEYVKSAGGGDIQMAARKLGSRGSMSLPLEFSEEKIKGSIHHELAHWIDDSLHNKHIVASLNKRRKMHANEKPLDNINTTYMEIEGQMHNIKQLHNKYSDKWDDISFVDMVSMSPTLHNIYNNLKGNQKITWIRNIKTRMHRENLLGKTMVSG